jgi:hypothetical protein
MKMYNYTSANHEKWPKNTTELSTKVEMQITECQKIDEIKSIRIVNGMQDY